MSKYTFEVRELVSTYGRDEIKAWFSEYELSDYLTAEEIAVINERGTWDKDKLAERIIDHYYTREIGTNAIGQFKLFVKDKMREVMETYAPLIYSASIKFDPLMVDDYTESYEGSNIDSTTTSSSGTGSGLVVSSDTPQGQINKNQILQGKYASSTSANESENTTSGSSDSTGNQSYTKTTKGKSTTAQNLIKQYREYIRALNTEIVYELEPLFMGLY